MSDTINIGGITVSKFYLGGSSDVKIYLGTTKLYPHLQEPCFAVVDNISTYTARTYVDVYETSSDKWYKLNNLSAYEQYGIYGSGRTITYYEGKLTIDGDYEYQYSGSSWVNVGEISGSTATLPNVPFVLNYNAKNYDATTHTIPMTEGQLNGMDAVITGTTSNIADYSSDGYIRLNGSTQTVLRARVSNSSNNSYFNRTNSNPNLTVVAKILTTSSSTSSDSTDILVNRDSNYNWMYRHKTSLVTLHGTSEQGSIAVSDTVPNICSARVDNNRLLAYNNWTQNTTSTYNGFNYGNTTTNGGTILASYATTNSNFWKGDFYWVYMSQNTLSDEEVQQVIAYNEEGGGQTEYPVYYDEIQDPPDNLSFSSMTEAESYECPWWGMSADIDNTDYMFCEGNEWLTKYTYIEVIGEYLCNNGNKYKKLQEYDRIPDGSTTAHTPATYVIGDLIESASTDCILPYTELQWIEMPQTSPYCAVQLADTYSNSTSLYYDFEILFNSLADTRIIGFASYSYLIGGNGSTIFMDTNRSRTFTISGQFTTDVKYHFGLGKRNSSSNNTFDNLDVSTTYVTFSTSLPTTNKPYFGAINQGSTLYVNGESERIYSIKVYDNEVLVGNYIPVKRNSDNFVTLYDTVSEQFCDTVGGGTMVAGPTV